MEELREKLKSHVGNEQTLTNDEFDHLCNVIRIFVAYPFLSYLDYCLNTCKQSSQYKDNEEHRMLVDICISTINTMIDSNKTGCKKIPVKITTEKNKKTALDVVISVWCCAEKYSKTQVILHDDLTEDTIKVICTETKFLSSMIPFYVFLFKIDSGEFYADICKLLDVESLELIGNSEKMDGYHIKGFAENRLSVYCGYHDSTTNKPYLKKEPSKK